MKFVWEHKYTKTELPKLIQGNFPSLGHAFMWANTSEGHAYWDEKYWKTTSLSPQDFHAIWLMKKAYDEKYKTEDGVKNG